MIIRLTSACLVPLVPLLIASCTAHRAYSDTTNVQERKSYIACAVTRAFLHSDIDLSPEDIARNAMSQCDAERQAVMFKLMEENADKPYGMKFVESYMNELQSAMLDHLVWRLTKSRARGHSDART